MSIDSRIGSSSSRCFTRKITSSSPSRAILFDDINKTVFCFSLYDPSKLAKNIHISICVTDVLFIFGY